MLAVSKPAEDMAVRAKERRHMNTNKTPTAKQAQVKIATLLRGIDNSSQTIAKNQDVIRKNVQEVKKLAQGLGSQEKTVPASKKPAAKKAAPAAKKKAAKKSASAAKKAPAKASKAPSNGLPKAPKVDGKKAPVDGRPPLKDALKDLISKAGGQPVSQAALYKQATDKWGYWSRQSLYVAMKDEKLFQKKGDGYVNAQSGSSKVSDGEADAFVRKATGVPDVAGVV